jgi:hypothetical protein
MYCCTVRSDSLTDVQSAGDLQRIRLTEQNLLRHDLLVTSNPEVARALRRHKLLIDRFYYYRAFTDEVKAGGFASALRLLQENPVGIGHVVLGSALRAPRIMEKALCGGYRRGSVHQSRWKADDQHKADSSALPETTVGNKIH